MAQAARAPSALAPPVTLAKLQARSVFKTLLNMESTIQNQEIKKLAKEVRRVAVEGINALMTLPEEIHGHPGFKAAIAAFHREVELGKKIELTEAKDDAYCETRASLYDIESRDFKEGGEG